MNKTKIKQFLSLHKILAAICLAILIGAGITGASISAQTVAQGFETDESLERGIIVVLDEDNPNKVEAATLQRVEDLYGVVINPNDASVTLSGEGEQVFVATNGRFQALVSTQNGPISTGDFITISSLEGIGMRADDITPVVIGRALSDFDGSNAVSTAQTGDRTVSIGRVQIDVLVANNPLQRPTEAQLPEFMRRAAESIAGKPVPAVRVYISAFIFIVSTYIAGSLMYSGVSSSIISIGRNPLSKKSIVRSMLQVVIVGLIIFIIGVFGVYLLLRL